jgi:hypothetical protein
MGFRRVHEVEDNHYLFLFLCRSVERGGASGMRQRVAVLIVAFVDHVI